MPSRSSTVGIRSMAWVNCGRISPRAARPFGQLMINGSAMPPLKTLRFQRLKGVLPAMVQPVA